VSTLLALILAQSSLAAMPAPLPEIDGSQEIVVIAARIRGVLLDVRPGADGQPTCTTRLSSGSESIDTYLCGEAKACVAQGSRTLSRLQKCIKRKKNALIKEIGRMRDREASGE
jgi:hypothetical protein